MRASDRLGARFAFAARRRTVRTRRTAYAARIPAIALLAALTVMFALLLQATQVAPLSLGAPVARAAANANVNADPSLTLVSPSSGQGPVGASVTVSGSGWTGGSVAIGAAQAQANCASNSSWTATFKTVTASGGSFTDTFRWPSSLSSGTYYLCAAPTAGGATAGGVAGQTYTVKASSPPALTLSSSNIQVGQTVTITGSNFVGVSTVNLSIGNTNTGVTPIQTVNPDGNGSFAVQYQPNGVVTGNLTIYASSPPDPGAPQPADSATASLLVLAAPTATATPSPSPSPAPSPTSAPTATAATLTTTTKNDTSNGGGLIALLIVGIVLSLLVIVGAAVFLLLRRRGGPGQAYPVSPGGGYSGTGPVTGYGQSVTGYGPAPTGRYSTSGTYGRSGIHDGPEPYNGPQIGSVAQWDEPDPQPGADWQPRPMSGSRARFDDPSYPGYPTTDNPPGGYPGSGQMGEPVPAPVPGHYGPPDPWASGAGAIGGNAWGNYSPAAGGPPHHGAPQPGGQAPRDPWQHNTGAGQGQPERTDDGTGRWQTRPEHPDEQW